MGNSGREAWSWLFFRASGLLLVFLALGHLAIMHVINTVDDIDYLWVADRWRSGGWRIYDGALLVLAVLHGMNGLRVALDDVAHRPSRRRWTNTGLVAGTLILLGLGTYTLATFEPVAIR